MEVTIPVPGDAELKFSAVAISGTGSVTVPLIIRIISQNSLRSATIILSIMISGRSIETIFFGRMPAYQLGKL